MRVQLLVEPKADHYLHKLLTRGLCSPKPHVEGEKRVKRPLLDSRKTLALLVHDTHFPSQYIPSFTSVLRFQLALTTSQSIEKNFRHRGSDIRLYQTEKRSAGCLFREL